tara:strand:+ start:2739 stop:4409 length:1671 start_codon:yes stop_codon:yes gene_type:complete
MLPLLFGGGITMGLLRGAGAVAGGALGAVGGAANLAATTLGIGASVAGAGLRAVGGGVSALGSAINPFSGDDSSKLTPGQGDKVETTQPNKVKQEQQKAVKQQQTATSKLTKQAEDTSRKSEKSGKSSAGLLAAMKMQLEKLNDKVGGIIRLVMSGQKQDNRRDLESKIEGARDTGDDTSVSGPGIMERGKNLMQKTGGFLSNVFGLIIKYFVAKIATLAFFPELAGQFKAFEESVVGFFKNTFDAVTKLFKGDIKGAKESAGLAFEDLGETLKSVAKFGSGIVDKILSFFGMEELNLFDKAAERFKDFKERFNSFLTDKSGIEAEDGNFTDRLFGAIKTVLMELVEKIAAFLSPANLTRIIAEGFERKSIKEDADKEVERILKPSSGLGERQEVRQAGFKEAERLVEEGKLEKITPVQLKKLIRDFEENPQSLTTEQREAAASIVDARDQEKQRLIDEIRQDQKKLLDAVGMEDPKQFNLQTAEKKLAQKVSGKDLNERGGGTIQPIQVVNSDSSSKSSVVNNNIVKSGSSGSGYGPVGPIEPTGHHIQSTYGNK